MIPKGPGYYALTRHAHIAEASRHPEIFQSGQGATSIMDMPEEMLDFFGSMINMDNPRHARLRRIVSAAFNPRMIKSIEDRIELRGRRRHRPGGRRWAAATSSSRWRPGSRSRSSAT